LAGIWFIRNAYARPLKWYFAFFRRLLIKPFSFKIFKWREILDCPRLSAYSNSQTHNTLFLQISAKHRSRVSSCKGK
jgi:hypothetical protein